MHITTFSKILGDPYQDSNKQIVLRMLETAQAQGFDIYKLEKDFYLTILLILISRECPELIFKGGTCLNKIYYDYYRLSEDLDFVLINEGGRSTRKNILEDYKQTFIALFSKIGLTWNDHRTKYNENQQGIFEFTYKSIIDKRSSDTIRVDIRIEPKLQKNTISKTIQAIYQDPISSQPFFHEHSIQVMHLDEIMAEKMRAALTRQYPAIRDFFDIWYARQHGFEFKNISSLIQTKVAEVDFKYTIDQAEDELQRQINTELNPVLQTDKNAFDLQDIYQYILSFKH